MKIGDVLYYVPYSGHRTDPHCIHVTKVGRRWAETERQQFMRGKIHQWPSVRIDVTNGKAEPNKQTGMCPGRTYPSEQAYDEHVALAKAWKDTADRLSPHSVPDGMTLATLAKIRILIWGDNQP